MHKLFPSARAKHAYDMQHLSGNEYNLLLHRFLCFFTSNVLNDIVYRKEAFLIFFLKMVKFDNY